MYKPNIHDVEEVFNEINRVLFFSQLNKPNIEIDSDLNFEYSYCFKEDGDDKYTLGITEQFQKFEHMKYVMVIEMIRLYQMDNLKETPSYNSLYSVFEYNAFKKFKDIEDPDDLIYTIDHPN